MSADAAPTLWWVRRDLRLADNPALRRAVDDGDGVLPLFVLDPAQLARADTARRAWLFAALHALDRDLRDAGGPGLHVRTGRPLEVVPATAAAADAQEVHVAATSPRTAAGATSGWPRPSPGRARS